MPTTKRPPLNQECIEARIVLRVAQLRELAARTAVEYWRERTGGNRFSMRGLERLPQRVALDAAVHSLRKLHREFVHRAKNQGNGGAKAKKMA